MDIHPTEISQGDNHDYQEVDQTEIDVPTEISEGENHDEEVIQRLTSGIRGVAKITAQLLTPEIRDGEIHDEEVIQRLASTIRKGAKKAESLSSACIYRVPEELRKLNKSAYTPRLIAIGPLHRNDPHLQTTMQDVKTSYMNNLLCRITQGMENQEAEQKKILEECVAAMEMSIEDAKKCYAEEVKLDVEMMLVDGCFILELLYRFYLIYDIYSEQGQETADPIMDNSLTRITVQHDLLLLENQIPFLVLEKLFPLTLAQIPNLPEKNLSLSDFVFLPIVEEVMRPTKVYDPTDIKKVYDPTDTFLWVLCNSREEEVSRGNYAKCYGHILHKLHDDYLLHDPTAYENLTEELPSASELVYAGVKFVRGMENNLFKVTFNEPKGLCWWYQRACFEIPYLVLDGSTEALLRNLIAFERYCPGILQPFTSYAKLMDMLVNDDIDVQVLGKAGVVLNNLGATKDATDLFNKLSKEPPYEEFFFAETCNKAIRYRKHFWPKNMAYLRRKYFASPWTFIAFCLGLVAFGLTITSFIRSFLK